MIALVESQPR